MWVAMVSPSARGHLWPSASGKLPALIRLMWSSLGKREGNRLMWSDLAVMGAIGKGQNKLRSCSAVDSEVFVYSQGKQKS